MAPLWIVWVLATNTSNDYEMTQQTYINWSNPLHLLAFGLGSGAAPKAPGTFGTIAAIPLYLLLNQLTQLHYLIVVLLLAGFGVWLCHVVAQDLGVHDHPGIVWDEWVGFFITMWLAPTGWGWLLLGFVLFRFFDIVKPWPIDLLDNNVPGGLGIMLDDVVAGLYSFALIQLAVYVYL
jgi:phosphatidylglycerophosphatase A